jgi:hypothetical protein
MTKLEQIKELRIQMCLIDTKEEYDELLKKVQEIVDSFTGDDDLVRQL